MNAFNTKIFKTGNSVAVRIPRDFGFEEGAEVTMEKDGSGIRIVPRHRPTVAEMLKVLRELPGPGEIQKRDPFEAPERPGL